VGHGLAESEKLTKNRDGFSPEIVFSFVTCELGNLLSTTGNIFTQPSYATKLV